MIGPQTWAAWKAAAVFPGDNPQPCQHKEDGRWHDHGPDGSWPCMYGPDEPCTLCGALPEAVTA